MGTVEQHYERHLAAIYVWMVGGLDAALRAGSAEIEELHLPIAQGDFVLDLGAGFGKHAIPLARGGARVAAIDSSAELLRTLQEARGDLPVQVINDDLLCFRSRITETPRAILCMGDTITHLPDFGAVESLIERCSVALQPAGTLVITFRDYSVPVRAEQRFIPVRDDERRILTCFLEYGDATVLVHDILHERISGVWQLRVSSYRKLRLPPERLVRMLEANGLSVRREAAPGGMIRLVATATRTS